MNKSFEELFRGYEKGLLNQEELEYFLNLVQQKDYEDQAKNQIEELLNQSTPLEDVDGNRADLIFKNIMKAAETEAVGAKIIALKKPSKVYRFLQIASAACIIGLVITMVFLLKKGGNNDFANKENIKATYKSDVPPGSNKATLTLADGSTIDLNDAKNGKLTSQGNTKVNKADGKLAYDLVGKQSAKIMYNSISTPRGGQYQITLSDGTMVWLNSASSLHFPTAFAGRERRVEITGEAYFEVKKNASMPFIVAANGAEVQVLGTHFNVMAYKEEGTLQTTLLEGSVKFTAGNNSSMLRPGQQSQLLKDGTVKVVSGVNMDEVMAWKNGLFHFESSDIETILRQLSRWYDVDVVFQGKKSLEPLHVELPRNTKLSDVLRALEISGGAKFEIQGKEIIVIK